MLKRVSEYSALSACIAIIGAWVGVKLRALLPRATRVPPCATLLGDITPSNSVTVSLAFVVVANSLKLSINTSNQNGKLPIPDHHHAKLTCQPPKKVRTETATAVSLGPQIQEGELVFGVAHIFAS
jgi:hypothetical protein